MNLDMPAQRLLINALKLQIQQWQERCEASDVDEEADIQNDIGYAFAVLGELEESFFKQFGHHPE